MKLHDFQFFTLETIIIQTLLLALILWVLHRFVFKPYLAYLDEETLKKKKLDEDYKNIEKLTKEAQESREKLLSDARVDAESMRKEALNLATKEAEVLKNQAIVDAGHIKQTALSEISKEKQSMLDELRQKSIDLILKLNGKLFTSEKVSRDFVETEINSIK